MIYRFGDCEVDTKLLELRRAGSATALDPLEFDLLTYLIEHRDRVLTRHELLDALWPGKVVTDSALSSRLKSVRGAVGDSGAGQRIIKTVHGRGYRFIAPLDDAPDDAVAAPAPHQRGDQRATSVIGRDPELGKLARWLERVRHGQRAIVFVSGEAGVGKTTLVRAFLDTVRLRTDTLELHGQCVNQREATEAYLPLLEALGRAGQRDADVADVLRRFAPAWLAQLPSLAGRHGDEDRGLALPLTTGRMFRELSEALDKLAERKPLVLVMEDLHWSDPSTIGWLEYYARRDERARLMLIATLRPDGPFRAACRELAIRGFAHELPLESIEEAEVGRYLEQRLHGPPSPGLSRLAFRRTGGFPLYIDTLVDHWLDRGQIVRVGDLWFAAADDSVLLNGVPESLTELIEQQLANLQQDDQRALETAALAQSPFAAAAIAHALDDAEENTEALFCRLTRQGRFVRSTGETRWPDGTVTATFEFRHELYREALYECLAASRRARLHCRLGERLERAYRDDPGPVAAQIAEHFARAHNAARALPYLYPAALRSFHRSAYRETVASVNRALDLIGGLAESAQTMRVERDLLLLRGSTLISLEGWASQGVEESYVRAQALGERLGLADNAPEIYGLAAMHENRGSYAKSQAVIESLLERSPGLEAYELLACSLFHQGRFEQSRRNADRAIAAYDPAEVSAILARYSENPGVGCHTWAALDLFLMGYPDSALKRSNQALQLAAGNPYSLCSALTQRTFLHQFRNEPDETLVWSERTLDVAEQYGFDYRIAQIMILAGWARGKLASDSHRQEAGLDSVNEGIRRHEEIGSVMDLPYQLTLKAELLAHMERLDDALATLTLAIKANPCDREFFYEAEMLRRYALLLLERDPRATERAEALLEQSLRVARRQGARMLELRACLSRCELGGVSVAARRKDLEAVLNSLQEVGDTPDGLAARAFA